MNATKARSEISSILVTGLGLALLWSVGAFFFATWVVQSLSIIGACWICMKCWAVREWISDFSGAPRAVEPSFERLTAVVPMTEPVKLEAPKTDSSSVIKVLLSSENGPMREKASVILSRAISKKLQQKVEVLVANSARETLALAIDQVFHLVILDAEYSGDLRSTDLYAEIKRLDKMIPVILLTERNITPLLGIDGFYRYPFQPETLDRILQHVSLQPAKVRHSSDNSRHL